MRFCQTQKITINTGVSFLAKLPAIQLRWIVADNYNMRVIFLLLLVFFAANAFAAPPLASGYALAPKATASPEDKMKTYQDLREKVIETAKKYEGVPYRYGGLTTAGLDCSGFLNLVFKEALNVPLPRSASAIYSWVEKTTLDRTQPGDFLFFATDESGKVTHVGLYLGDKRFIHAASSGPKTGVIYSSIDEKYWTDAYVGAGRAFPEAASTFKMKNNSITGNSDAKDARANKASSSKKENRNGRLLAGVAFAPIFNGFLAEGDFFRGFTSQLSLSLDASPLRMVLGLELRQEYDKSLGVFRLPLTLSFGPNEKIRVFAGPVFSFGDASLSVNGKQRYYSAGSRWFGTAGITISPFVLKTSAGNIAPYAEAAWQSYYSDNADVNVAADFFAKTRFSTGIRWMIKVN
jgi:probable lipoprotein NlpC